MTALSAAQAGAYYEIKWNVCTGESAALTAKYDLSTGKSVFLASSYFGNVIVRVQGKLLALGSDVASRIKV